MKALKFLALITLGSVLLFSCDLFGGSEEVEGLEDWLEVTTEWTDDDGSQLSFVDSGDGDYMIDIGYDAEVRLFDPWVMGYIAADAYTISDNTLVGVYTSNDNTNSEEEFDITIDFSYSGGVLTAVVVADGALGNKTLNLVPVE